MKLQNPGLKKRQKGYLFYAKKKNVIKRGKRKSEIDKITVKGRVGRED